MEESPIRSSIFSLPIEAIKYEDILSFCDKQMEEGVDLDYKADWPNDLEKVICSFANTQGGIALIGGQRGKERHADQNVHQKASLAQLMLKAKSAKSIF